MSRTQLFTIDNVRWLRARLGECRRQRERMERKSTSDRPALQIYREDST